MPAKTQLQFAIQPSLSLYVHLPWCERKCPYCDFNSFEHATPLPMDDYVAALMRDLDAERDLAGDRPLHSIFIGGGTPSLFSAAAITRLIDGIRARLELADECEITLEANPGSVEADRFAGFLRAGVDRLSIGVQSLRDAQLRALGRVHNRTAALRAYDMAAGAGFERINLDLMYGLPGDDVAGAIGDLQTAIELGPSHLSWYQLTLEPNTAFHRRPPQLPSDETIAEIEFYGRALLAEHGYERYEISAYAKAGHRCAHNLHYWRFGDYLGIGAGAHGKITDTSGLQRRSKQRNPLTFMHHAGKASACAVERIESAAQVRIEFMMNALRLIDGVSVGTFERRAGQAVAELERPLTQAAQRGWMYSDPSRLRATATGLEVLNSLLLLF